MKIVLATAFPADPAAPRGGVEAVSVVLTRALAADPALDVHVVTARAECASVQVSSWNGATVHALPWQARRMLQGAAGRAGADVRGYVSRLSPDVVHAHDTYGIMLQAIDRPRVLTIHGFIYADTRVSGERLAWLRSHAWRRVETAAWARYPRIISISPYVRERLAGIATGVVHDIDNPIDETFFGVQRREEGNRIFCAAAVSPRKNTLALVEAFARLSERGVSATLRIAGPRPAPEYAEQVERRVRELGLEGQIALLPSLSTDEVRDELSRTSVLALVSLEENAPLTVQEAMAAGVPVVTSNRCGMPYQVSDGENGLLVDPLDPNDIATALHTLIADPARRARFGDCARQDARRRFHPESVARRTRAVYERAVSSEAGATP